MLCTYAHAHEYLKMGHPYPMAGTCKLTIGEQHGVTRLSWRTSSFIRRRELAGAELHPNTN